MIFSWLFAALLFALIELKLLFVAGEAVGGSLLFAWLLFSVLLGLRSLRVGGRRALAGGTWGTTARDMAHGKIRLGSRLDGVLVVVAGLLLLLPGLLGDAAGLLLLVPWVRGRLLHRCQHWLTRRFRVVPAEVDRRGPIPARDQVVEVRAEGR